MPAFAPITILDGEDTPISHTFNPDRIDNEGIARYRESSGVRAGDNKLSASLKETPTKVKVRFILALPVTVTETVNGVDNPSIARNEFVEIIFTSDKNSLPQERDNAIVLAQNLLAHATTRSLVVDQESTY